MLPRIVGIIRRSLHVTSIVCNESTMKVLNVAEKNDAAKNIASLLSNGNSRRREGKSKFNKIYEFRSQVLGQNCDMIMTSVSGHLTELEFVGAYKSWTKCNPENLFDCPINRFTHDKHMPIKKTLETEVKNCEALIIWTDCDREGENIGYEIIDVCKKVRSNLRVYRAKFSEITAQSVKRALANLEQPDKKVSDAVTVRSELDFRIGCAFTRFQTLRLCKVFPLLADYLLSYGPCQFPTLGFVVERYLERERFIPESFWKIKVTHEKDDLKVEYSWKRNRLFDEQIVRAILEKCLENKMATVESIQSKPKSKWRPTPLDTTELEKVVSRKLKINAKETMRIAEKLYTQGLISYPRTETNIYPDSLDLQPLVQDQVQDSRWGGFANKVLDWGPTPRQGKKSDQSHPPIHPLKYTDSLSGNEARVYEFIVRHFLACISKDAQGHETTVAIDINGEKFSASGLMILEKNYLEVYIYDSWSSKAMHVYRVGEQFEPSILDVVGGQTTPPNLLTEADLISLMEKHGIGTDATHAEHIETIKARFYVAVENGGFVPSAVGMGLVEGYDTMGFQMSKPNLRASLESDLVKVCEGRKQPEEVLREQIHKYREVFRKAREQVQMIDTAMSKYIGQDAQVLDEEPFVPSDAVSLGHKVMECKSCKRDMTLTTGTNGKFYINCVGFPQCKTSIWVPAKVLSVQVSDQTCPRCGPNVKLLDFKFKPGSMIPFYPDQYLGCVRGCEKDFIEMLGVNIITAGGRVSAQSTATNSRAPSQRPTTTTRPNNNVVIPPRPNMTNGFPPNSRNNQENDRRGGGDDGARRGKKRKHEGGDDDDDDNNNDDPSTGPCCSCGQPSKRLTARKEGPNQGRDFFVCAKDSDAKCNFYMWADEFTDGLVCMCNLPARKCTVRKEGPNQGREFFGCSKYGEGRCQFFLWAEDVGKQTQGKQARAGPSSSSSRGSSSRGRGGTSRGGSSQFRAKSTTNKSRTTEPKTRKCGVCGEPGHNRRNCPHNAGDL